jgi:DNA-binding NarL/FixJ family response regulator
MHGYKQARGEHLEEVNGETMTTLLLVEDEALIRHGLRAWLDQAPNVTVVGEATNGAEAMLLAQVLGPDVILVDLSLPPMDGIKTTTALRRAAPQSSVVLLSLEDGMTMRARAQAAGAVAFVGKQEGVRALVAAIRLAGCLKHRSLPPHARREERP